MAAKPSLAVVKPGARVQKSPLKTVSQAAESGSRRELLVAMRDRIAKTVEDPCCPPRDLAALTRRLQDIAREIEALDVADQQEAERGGPVSDEVFDAEAL
jgi:hypothetical protein